MPYKAIGSNISVLSRALVALLDDSGGGRHTPTAFGAVALDGSGSCVWTGAAGDIITVPSSADWKPTGDYSVKVEVSPDGVGNFGTLVGLVSGTGGAWGDIGWVLRYEEDGTIFWQASDGGGTGRFIAGSTDISALSNALVEFTVISGTVYLFVNGNLEGSIGAPTWYDSAWSLRLGEGSIVGKVFDGSMSNVIIKTTGNGHTTSYTPDGTEFNNDTDTVLLLEFEGESGSTDIKDSANL